MADKSGSGRFMLTTYTVTRLRGVSRVFVYVHIDIVKQHVKNEFVSEWQKNPNFRRVMRIVGFFITLEVFLRDFVPSYQLVKLLDLTRG
jgi:hypothetical protein